MASANDEPVALRLEPSGALVPTVGDVDRARDEADVARREAEERAASLLAELQALEKR